MYYINLYFFGQMEIKNIFKVWYNLKLNDVLNKIFVIFFNQYIKIQIEDIFVKGFFINFDYYLVIGQIFIFCFKLFYIFKFVFRYFFKE